MLDFLFSYKREIHWPTELPEMMLGDDLRLCHPRDLILIYICSTPPPPTGIFIIWISYLISGLKH